MQDDTTTQEIEEKLSERLLGNESENDYAESNVFRIDGSGRVDISATAIMEGGGDIIVDGTNGTGGFGGPLQPEYRDAPFALAFLAHIGVVCFFAFAWGAPSLRRNVASAEGGDDEDGDASGETVSLYGLLLLSLIACAISVGISALSLRVMMHHAETLIQASLIGSLCFKAIYIVFFLLDGLFWYAGGFALLFLLTAWYAKRVWHRIPFASSNLRTALSAIQTNAGICALAYVIAGLANVWTIVWVLATVGVSFKESTCDANVCQPNLNAITIALLCLSYYWTIQVFQNVLHVTVSGVVGTWWFAPQDALSVFSPSIVDSFRRATTYSFGSICMGSLLVAVIQTLESLARRARRQNRGGLLLCVLECILRLLSRLTRYFNRWSYCYVGLYGFDYISSGKKVVELFEAKGWNNIITDNLVHRSLTLVAVVVGAMTGFLGMLLAKVTGWATSTFGAESDGAVFSVCFLIGLSMAMILMKVVLAAVDTVIVAFAEAPGEFQTHHPALANNMILKWRRVFPDECGF
eukprot:CAMPEP_0197178808 /NCGR_PEP_ID=MMETSP1423-20130617/3972_1 /TAXON_ID=476441 /ORGANISM="Pseudo-nitzschia heimii, Strain UNC1101" /LENGTH=522 /DNA_ID=CAMNT_0042628621 /DNA_START=188 /DNA_END=1756 /DNA_ORIENTATION=-